MKKFVYALSIFAFLCPAMAHGPTPQKVEEKVTIAADPKAVWELVAEFGDIGKWHPAVAASESPDGNKAGATRKLTLKKGGELLEDLDEYDAAEMTYSYRLEDPNLEALPVSFYSATLKVEPADDGKTNVEWLSRFYRGDTGNFPPDDLNDEAAVKAMKDFFSAGLNGLKAKAEH